MDAYDRVYAKSWKKPEPYPEFVRRWARICADNGWLRLGVAWVDDVPIAAQFWFTMDRRAYIFKLAYDEDYSKWSAGTVLTAHMVRHSLEQDAVVEIDYLTGDDPYKKTWMTHRRERVGLIACNRRTARGMFTATVEYAGALRKRWRAPTRQPDDGRAAM
jgi:CelD/BcsL family acetyltransferase involved in cellulose biosynthesis